jgi:hypothetical protein
MLPHPGPEVTKKKYTGDLGVINPSFLALIHRLAVSVFGTNLNAPTEQGRQQEQVLPKAHKADDGQCGACPSQGSVVKKRVGEHSLTAMELLGYVRNYVQVFHEASQGDGVFPEAKTLLAATAEANNYNAVEHGVKRYKTAMDKVQPPPAMGMSVALAKISIVIRFVEQSSRLWCRRRSTRATRSTKRRPSITTTGWPPWDQSPRSLSSGNISS